MGYQNGHICIGAILEFNPSYQSGSQKKKVGTALEGALVALQGRDLCSLFSYQGTADTLMGKGELPLKTLRAHS